jgi:uncharacterized protein (TIGR04222 family)
MNPLDLRGPEFLLFYLGACLAAAVTYQVWRQLSNHVGAPGELPTDPYLIAYLRGGRLEALRTALFKLLAEGALTREGRLVTRENADPPRPLEPFEAEVWKELDGWRTLDTLDRDGVGAGEGSAMEERLDALGYRRSDADNNRDHIISMLLGAVLVILAVVKIEMALSRGHANVMFLVLLSFAAGAIAIRKPSAMTSRGRRALEGTQALLQRPSQRAQMRAPAEPAELAMVMAAFGVVAFRLTDYPFLAALGGTNLQLGAGAGGGGSSCSSTFSCSGGSSCGSSCGGGCGGGGCGGCGS